MVRAIVLIFLTAISVYGQDSILVREFCSKLGQLSETNDINDQISDIEDMTRKYLERNPLKGDNPTQDGIRFQYRLMIALKKGCPGYSLDRVRLIPKAVIDLENRFSNKQIDSLSMLTSQIKREEGVHLYVVTIDDFFPDSTITEFANRYREFWAPRTTPEKGVVLIVISVTKGEVRVSTGSISMTHLTDKECDDVIKVMVTHFKSKRYFDGLTNGLLAIKSRL